MSIGVEPERFMLIVRCFFIGHIQGSFGKVGGGAMEVFRKALGAGGLYALTKLRSRAFKSADGGRLNVGDRLVRHHSLVFKGLEGSVRFY